jgi:nucleoside-diphosphate-sugar epimerase
VAGFFVPRFFVPRFFVAGYFVKQRVLVLGSEHFVAARVQKALSASDWATPVPFFGPPASLSEAHLAGIHSVFNGSMGQPDAILKPAQALYGALERIGSGPRVVHLSSMTVYGTRSGEVVETAALRSDLGAYGAAQVAAESLAVRYPRSVILRPGCEYGPGCPQWSERIAHLLCSHRLGDLGAAGDGVCNLLFVDDLVEAILKSLKAPGVDGACFNLAMRSPPTWNEYFTRFARALGAVPVSRIGARRLKIEARLAAPPLKLLEMMQRRLGLARAISPAITPSLLSLCGQNITLSSRKAEEALDLAWTPLHEGLRRAAASFKGA